MQKLARHSAGVLRVNLGLFCLLLAGPVKAQVTSYWDVNGATPGAGGPTPNGNWEDANWTTDPSGAIDTASWIEGSLAYFSADADATDFYTVTANADHTITGIQLQYPPVGAVTINGPGRLLLPEGMQPLAGGAPSLPLTINAVLAGTGGCLIPANTVVYLGGTNTFSGGCAFNGGQAYFNNGSAFGTGPITNTLGGFSALLAYGGTPLTLPNDFEINVAGDGINFAGVVANTPVTSTGNWDLQQTLRLRNNSDSTCPLTLSGVISGAPAMGLAISGNYGVNLGGMITLSGANTFDGPVSIGDGGGGATLVVSSFNSVGNPQPSSSLGRPTSVANGTIAIGYYSTTNTLVYLGPGETTDRVIDFAGTARGPWLQADGTGPLVFTSDFTATGSGSAANTKTLILQGTNSGNNEIRGKIVDHGVDGGINFQTAVAKLGTGTWMLSGPNTYSAGTTISGGTLKIGADNTLPYGTGMGNLTIDGTGPAAATLDLNGHNIAVNGLSLGASGKPNAVIDNTSSTACTLTVSGGTGDWYGTIKNTGGGDLNLIKPGGSIQNHCTWLGGITINSGTFWCDYKDSIGGTPSSPRVCVTLNGSAQFRDNKHGSITFDANQQFYLGSATVTLKVGYANGNVMTIPGKITGPGALNLQGDNKASQAFVLSNPANDYAGDTTLGGAGGTGLTVKLGADNVIPHGAGKGNVYLKVAKGGTLDMNGHSATVNGLNADGTTTTLVDNSAASTASTLAVGDNDTTGTFSGIIKNTGSGSTLALTKIGSGNETLSGANTYSGATTINGGTLALSGSGSLANSPSITVAGGATFDVSALTIALTLGGSQTLQAGGTSGASATLATASGKGLTLGATSPLLFTAVDGSTVPLSIAGAGSLTLAAGNPVTITTTTKLAPGSYKLIAKGTSGSVLGAVPTSLTIAGAGVDANATTSLSLSGAELYLNVVVLASVTQMSLAPAADGKLSLSYSGGAGSQFVLLQTNNVAAPVANWTRVQTNTAASGSFTITPGSDPAEFYRVKSE